MQHAERGWAEGKEGWLGPITRAKTESIVKTEVSLQSKKKKVGKLLQLSAEPVKRVI